MTAAVTPGREELLALADKFEAGTHKAVATGYEEYGEAFQRERKMIVDSLRLAAKPADERRKPATRWKVTELRTHFGIECERPCYHIEIHYGDHAHNIPNFGTKDQARADAECIATALNARDAPTTGAPKP